MLSEPLVSVIMSVHNCEAYIEEALGSMLQQTYKNLEIIIFDDGSTDKTGEIIAKMSEDEYRVFYHYRQQQGIANCLNEALSLAKGDFIARMDGDDISLPDRIEKQMAFLNEHPEVDVVGCWLRLFGERNEVWHYRAYDNFIKNMFFLFSNGVGHNAILVRADVYKRYRYDPRYTYVEDTELWIRMAVDYPSVTFYNLREVLVLYRVHDAQSSVIRKEQQRILYLDIIARYLESLGVEHSFLDMEAHEWLADQAISLSDVQLYRLAKWLNYFTRKKNVLLPDTYGVLAERWHHLCRKNETSLDIYNIYKADFDICWLPRYGC